MSADFMHSSRGFLAPPGMQASCLQPSASTPKPLIGQRSGELGAEMIGGNMER